MELFKLFGSIFIDNDSANESIDNTDKKGKGLFGTLGNVAGNAGKVGAVLGGALVTGAGLAAGAIGALFLSGESMNKALVNLQQQTGATDDEMNGLKDSLIEIYRNNYGESFEDIADSMALIKQNTGLVGEELEEATKYALIFRDSLGFDVSESTETVSIMMKQFGIDSKEAYTLLAQGQQQGLNYSDDMLDSFSEYSVYFQQLGFDAEGMWDVFKAGADGGAFNLDKVGDSIKELGIRVKDGSKTTDAGFSALGLNADDMAAKFAKGGDSAQQALKETFKALSNIEDPIERNSAGVNLFGTQFEDLEYKTILALGNVRSQADMTADTLDTLDKVKYNSVGEAIKGIWRIIQGDLLIPIQEKMMPIINDSVNFFRENLPLAIDYLKDKFGSFLPSLDNLKQMFTTSFQVVKDTVIDTFNFLQPYIMPILDSIVTFVGDKVRMIAQFWEENGQQIMLAVQNAFQFIKSIIEFVMPAVLLVISMVWESIKGVINGALNIIMGLIKVFTGIFTGDFSKMWEGLKQIFSGAIEFIWNYINLLFVGRILGGIKSFVSNGVSFLKNFWSKGVEIFKNLDTEIWKIVSSFISKILGKFKNLYEEGSRIFGTLKTFGANTFSAMRDAIRTVVEKMVSNTVSKIKGIYTGAKDSFNNLLSTAKSIFGKIKSAITNPIDSAKTAVSNTIGKIKGLFSGLSLKLPDIKTPHFKIKNWSKNPLDWVKNMPSIAVDWYAKGTNYAKGGLSVVGEHGPELLNIPRGSQVKNASETRGIMNEDSNNDIEVLELLRVIAQRIGGDIYMSSEKVGSVMDKEFSRRITLEKRRVAID